MLGDGLMLRLMLTIQMSRLDATNHSTFIYNYFIDFWPFAQFVCSAQKLYVDNLQTKPFNSNIN